MVYNKLNFVDFSVHQSVLILAEPQLYSLIKCYNIFNAQLLVLQKI